jgi:hypothetical protein
MEYQKKKIIEEINNFPSNVHEKIFELILKNSPNIPYNSNNQYTFIDLNIISNDTFKKIYDFVNLCKENLNYQHEIDFLFEKAQENIYNIYTNDYDLDNFSQIKNGIKIEENDDNKKMIN